MKPIALMIAGLVIAAVAAACAPRVPMDAEAPSSQEPMYCFSVELKHTKGRRMVGCADTLPLCREALGTARKYGRIAGVKRLRRCELRSFD